MGSNGKRVESKRGSESRAGVLRATFVQNETQETTSTFQTAVEAALQIGDIQLARCLVAEEEARQIETVGATHATVTADIYAAKARIALATDDGLAAQAILLTAIEAAPKNRSLRVLMSEVMLATGRASDVRPVLQHVGKRSTDRPDGLHSAGDAS
jgi:thioredoxin-like negative regulator of GroEL